MPTARLMMSKASNIAEASESASSVFAVLFAAKLYCNTGGAKKEEECENYGEMDDHTICTNLDQFQNNKKKSPFM